MQLGAAPARHATPNCHRRDRRDVRRRGRPSLGGDGRRRGHRRSARRGAGVIAVIQFDAASTRLLERLGGEGRLPNLEALRRRGTRAGARHPRRALSRQRLPGPLPRGRGRRPRALLSLPVGGRRPAHPTGRGRSSAPPPIWDRLGRAGCSTARDRPVRVPPSHRGRGRALLRLGDARAGRARALGGARRSRPHPAPPPWPPAGRDRGLRRADAARTAPPARALPPRPGPGRRPGNRAAARAQLRPRLDRLRRPASRRPPTVGRSGARGDLPGGRRPARPRPRRAARRQRRDRLLGARDGRQHQPRRPAAGDARRRPGRREPSRGSYVPERATKEPRNGADSDSGAIWRLRGALSGRLRAPSPRRCPTGWRWS